MQTIGDYLRIKFGVSISHKKKISNSYKFVKKYSKKFTFQKYRNPFMPVHKFVKMKDDFNICEREIIYDYFKRMEYSKFLESRYWCLIASYIKCKVEGYCMNCDTRAPLHIHHINYSQRGKEIKLQNLMPLCENCHRNVHINKVEMSQKGLLKYNEYFNTYIIPG